MHYWHYSVWPRALMIQGKDLYWNTVALHRQDNVRLSCHCSCHDDVMSWKHFQHYWPFVRWIHRWPMDFPQVMLSFDDFGGLNKRSSCQGFLRPWRSCGVTVMHFCGKWNVIQSISVCLVKDGGWFFFLVSRYLSPRASVFACWC